MRATEDARVQDEDRPSVLAISHKELADCFYTDGTQVVDVRDIDFFTGHIPGVRHVPSQEFDENLADLASEFANSGKQLVFLCMTSERRAKRCARTFLAYLRENVPYHTCTVRILEGGFCQWQKAFATQANSQHYISRSFLFNPFRRRGITASRCRAQTPRSLTPSCRAGRGAQQDDGKKLHSVRSHTEGCLPALQQDHNQDPNSSSEDRSRDPSSSSEESHEGAQQPSEAGWQPPLVQPQLPASAAAAAAATSAAGTGLSAPSSSATGAGAVRDEVWRPTVGDQAWAMDDSHTADESSSRGSHEMGQLEVGTPVWVHSCSTSGRTGWFEGVVTDVASGQVKVQYFAEHRCRTRALPSGSDMLLAKLAGGGPASEASNSSSGGDPEGERPGHGLEATGSGLRSRAARDSAGLPEQIVPYMKLATLVSLFRTSPHVQVIDIRDASAFQLGHIPGSRQVSPEDFAEKLPGLAQEYALSGKTLVFLCSTSRIWAPRCASCFQQHLEAQYTKYHCKVYVLKGGFLGWESFFIERG